MTHAAVLIHVYINKSDSQLHQIVSALQNVLASPPINISLGTCQLAKDYKKKNAFRLT